MVSGDSRLLRPKLKFESNYLLLPNSWARGVGAPNARLSLRAIGLLTQLMSHDDGFSVTFRQLARDNEEGMEAIQRAVGELKRAGYLRIERDRYRGKIVGSVWVLQDPSELAAQQLPLDPDYPHAAEPDAAEPHAGKPHADNPHAIEVLAREDLHTSERTSSSTRARDEDDLDHLAAVCPSTRSAHVFDTPDGWCRNCSRMRGDGSLYDANGVLLRAGVAS